MSEGVVLITGACGNLGYKLSTYLKEQCVKLVLLDIKFRDAFRDQFKDAQLITADLRTWNPSWVDSFNGVDAVYHFAAQMPLPDATWEDSARSIDITSNVLFAASKAGVRRFVFATSNHVMGGYVYKNLQPGQLKTTLPPLVGTKFTLGKVSKDSTPYASAKLHGERLCETFVGSGQLNSAIAVRIGWCNVGKNTPDMIRAIGEPVSSDVLQQSAVDKTDKLQSLLLSWFRGMWLSNDDFITLMDRCRHADLSSENKYVLVNGMSSNKDQLWDQTVGKEVLGYHAKSDAYSFLKST
mmetsp:Transcript_13803/g.15233  ORF Transcript_13803/g.15233 Transcript_13803/m.15233 type:complete len:296 (+) Transcript_13803:30-917(+)